MPVKHGTQGTSPIYNGVDKIGSIYRGIDLVYQSSSEHLLFVPYVQQQLEEIKEKDLLGVTKIYDYSFQNQTNLSKVEIPETVEEIGSNAFSGCSNITNINIPNSVKTLGQRCLSSMGLKTLTVPNSVTSINYAPFSRNSNLTVAYIYCTNSEHKITSQDGGWFWNCPDSLVIHIPKSVTDPDTAYGAKWNCYNDDGARFSYIADL